MQIDKQVYYQQPRF